MSRTALILGAGLGGVVVAETLRKLLPADWRVIAADRAEQHVFPPSLLWLMVGARRPEEFSRPLARLAERGVEFRQGEVTRIDPQARAAEIDGQKVSADALVIALGAAYAPESVAGLAEAGLCVYTLEGASAIRAALEHFSGGRVVVLTAAPQYKCPAGPYEAALLVDHFLRQRGMRERTEIDFYAAEPAPMIVAGPEMGRAVREMLEARGIRYHPEHQVASVETRSRGLRFANGAVAQFDLLLYVPPHRVPAVVREAALTDATGWVPVDRHTLETRFPNVYAIGDVVSIPLKMGRPLPKAGVFAHGQAIVVAHNIARAWTGKGAPQRFDGSGMCFIETGNGRAGMGSGDFYAEPVPRITVRSPSLLWHAGKVWYEKYWLWSRF